MSDMESRFWSKVDMRGPDECWPWRAGHFSDGYGAFGVNGKPRHSHVVAWRLYYQGPVKPDAVYRHHCDNKPCTNPHHVTPGTNWDNSQDMVKRGRVAAGPRHGTKTKPESVARGERNSQAKLTVRDVLEIRASDLPYVELEKRYGVDPTYLSKIRNRHFWRHV